MVLVPAVSAVRCWKLLRVLLEVLPVLMLLEVLVVLTLPEVWYFLVVLWFLATIRLFAMELFAILWLVAALSLLEVLLEVSVGPVDVAVSSAGPRVAGIRRQPRTVESCDVS